MQFGRLVCYWSGWCGYVFNLVVCVKIVGGIVLELFRNGILIYYFVKGWMLVDNCKLIVMDQNFGNKGLCVIFVGYYSFIGICRVEGDQIVCFNFGYGVGFCECIVGFIDWIDNVIGCWFFVWSWFDNWNDVVMGFIYGRVDQIVYCVIYDYEFVIFVFFDVDYFVDYDICIVCDQMFWFDFDFVVQMVQFFFD